MYGPYLRFAAEIERFIPKILFAESGCWLWQAAHGQNGYPIFRRSVNGSLILAHRYAYRYWNGPIPTGYEIDHLCFVPACVNPDHLEAVPPKVNKARRRNVYVLQGARNVATEGGRKDDADKLRYDLIPAYPLARLAEVYTIGSRKYSDENWRKGISYKRIFGAMMRHAWAWMAGQTLDPNDGQHHLASVAWCAFALMEYEFTHKEFDDRAVYPKS